MRPPQPVGPLGQSLLADAAHMSHVVIGFHDHRPHPRTNAGKLAPPCRVGTGNLRCIRWRWDIISHHYPRVTQGEQDTFSTLPGDRMKAQARTRARKIILLYENEEASGAGEKSS